MMQPESMRDQIVRLAPDLPDSLADWLTRVENRALRYEQYVGNDRDCGTHGPGPLGVMPRGLHDMIRARDLIAGLMRFSIHSSMEDKPMDAETMLPWTKELTEIMERLTK